MQDSTNESINYWNKRSIFLSISLSLKSIDKKILKQLFASYKRHTQTKQIQKGSKSIQYCNPNFMGVISVTVVRTFQFGEWWWQSITSNRTPEYSD